MGIYEELNTELTKALEANVQKRVSGRLGYTPEDTYYVHVPNSPAKYYVRFEDGTFIEAFHLGRVAPVPDMPVWVIQERNLAYIQSVDLDKFEEFANNLAADAQVGKHSHARFSNNEFEVDARLFKAFHLDAGDGLNITIGEGFFQNGSTLALWEGGGIDLTAYLPVTANHVCWVIVGIDPSTDPYSLIAVAGTSQSKLVPLTKSQIATISFVQDGYVPVYAVQLIEGQTDLTEYDVEALHAMAAFPVVTTADVTGASDDAIILSIMGW